MSVEELSTRPERSNELTQSLERGLAVIQVFDAQHSQLTLAAVAKLAGLSRATARRILHTLVALGYACTDGKTFELTPKVLDLGYAYLSSFHVGDIAQPYMEALSERVDESVSVAVLDGLDVVYVARVPTKRIMRIALGLGSRLPALWTSLGRVLVADADEAEQRRLITADAQVERPELPSPRRTPEELLELLAGVHSAGYAFVDEELELGLRSIAAPLRDRNGRSLAAMNVSTSVRRVDKRRLMSEFLPALLDAAAAVSAQLAKR